MKAKKILSAFLAAVILMLGCMPAFAADEIPEGCTPIYSAKDLDNIRNGLAGKYILMNDIDLSAYENWQPIGTVNAPFTGELNGNGFVISSLTINAEYSEGENLYFGLFGYAKAETVSDTVKNLSIDDAKINVIYKGTGNARCRVGVFMGYGYMVSISNCAVSGNVYVEGFPKIEIGGIIGKCKMGWLTRCANYADIDVALNEKATQVMVGGNTGVAEGTENECCNYGNISVKGNNVDSECIIKMGGIDGDGSYNMNLSNSYNRGNICVDFSTSETYIGGLSGESCITQNSYNTGKVDCPENFSGCAGAISGSVISGVASIGDEPHMENAYYIDAEMIPAFEGKTSFDDLADDYRDRIFVNTKTLSETEMMQQASFVGFDFENTWKMEENGYPILVNEVKIEKSETDVPEANPEPPADNCPMSEWWIVKFVKWVVEAVIGMIKYIINFTVGVF